MFSGFTDKDFDAYAPTKWKSNVFNRERLEVKQKLLALGKELAGSLTAADGSPLACEASVEHPALWNHKQVEAQHLFFARNEGARRELDQIIDRSRSMTTMRGWWSSVSLAAIVAMTVKRRFGPNRSVSLGRMRFIGKTSMQPRRRQPGRWSGWAVLAPRQG